MASAFPFPPPTAPQKRLNCSSRAVVAGLGLLLIVLALIDSGAGA
jgi:hypothetical protein